MCHSTQNAILIKFSLWEYGNEGAPFSWRKFGRVLYLVHYGAFVGFQAYIYGVCQHAHAGTSWSPSKHQTYWCASHTRGNRYHLVTWIGTITLQWSCTQYSVNSNSLRHISTLQGQKHLWLERVTHVATRVHHTKSTITHTQAYIDIHTSCTMLSHRVGMWSRHYLRPKGMAQQGTRNVKQIFPYPRNAAQAKCRKDKWYMERKP